MNRQLLGSFSPAAAVASLNVTVQAMNSDLTFHEDTFVPRGKYFQAKVPDTLDLAERAKLSVHGLTSFLNPESTKPPARYGPFGHTYFNADPPYMSDMPGGPPTWGKISESLLLARVMSGSRENMDVDAKTFPGMIQYISLDPKVPTPMWRVMLAMIVNVKWGAIYASGRRQVRWEDGT